MPLILILIIAMTAHLQGTSSRIFIAHEYILTTCTATVGDQLGFEVAQAEVKNDDPCPVYYTPGLFRK